MPTGRQRRDPEMQSIPIPGTPAEKAARRRIREAFLPTAGQLFANIDYSQLEMRIMAQIEACDGDSFPYGKPSV